MVEKKIIKGRAPFSDAVRVGHSVFISGQVPKDPIKGGWADNIRGQTTQCLENIKTILEKAGGDVTDLVKLAIYLTEAFLDFFKENGVEKDFPARTAVQVGPLFYHEWKIEIEAVAIIKE
ncbi:MAG: RidA family protein [Promethearchaeota archaeon]